MPRVEGMTSEIVARMSCRHQTLFFGSGGYYIICAECSYMWVARDPLKGDDVPDQNFSHGAQLSPHDIRIDPTMEK
jgi:hypothetical protein